MSANHWNRYTGQEIYIINNPTDLLQNPGQFLPPADAHFEKGLYKEKLLLHSLIENGKILDLSFLML